MVYVLTASKGPLDASDLVDNLFTITPILTVFFPENDNDDGDDTDADNLVTETVAQLTCLKAIDLTTASNDTQSPGEGDSGNGGNAGNGGNGGNGDDGSAAGRMVASGSLAVWGGLLSAALVLLA
jgi:hypothetical protein